MADVKRKHNPIARSAALTGWALALLSASATLGEEHGVPSSYYLTVKLVKSHLPEEQHVLSDRLKRLFSGEYTTGTLQIEFDVLGKNSYHSTTVARAFEFEKGSLVSRSFGRMKDSKKTYELSDYEIVSNRKLYRDDKITLGVMYSATHQSIDTMEAFLENATGPFKVADFTYAGLASQALRVFARSSDTEHSKYIGHLHGKDCLILAPNEEDTLCPQNGSDLNFPYVKFDLDVSHTRFALGDQSKLLSDLYTYMESKHGEQLARFLDAAKKKKGPQLDEDCREIQEALDRDLVRDDRNLMLLGLLKKMDFDPDAEEPSACWIDHVDSLQPLMDKYRALRLGDCERNNDVSRMQCKLVSRFLSSWRGVLEYTGGPLSWEVRRGRHLDVVAGEGDVGELRKRYRLELRYGNFKRRREEWTVAGSIYDMDRKCMFTAEIGISVAADQDAGKSSVKSLRVYASSNVTIPRSSIKSSAAWEHHSECKERGA